MKKPKSTAHAPATFKIIPIELVPRLGRTIDNTAIERALEVAQENPKKAVIAFSGSIKEAGRYREHAVRFLVTTKRKKTYQCTRRQGQVFIWKLPAA